VRTEVKNMTETKKDLGACITGGSTDAPCPYPATVELPHKFPDGVGLCAFHAATEPLVNEVNELGVVVELLRGYLKHACEYVAAEGLVEALEYIEADFSGRLELAEKVCEDLHAAEMALMRS
jgi:hypothetical protein